MKKSSYLKVAGVCLCATLAIAVPSMFNTARAIDSPVEKIEGILGAEIGDVTDEDVADIVDVVNAVLNVGNAPHTVPKECPDNIKSEIDRYVNFNSDGVGFSGNVERYETILYGNGQFVVDMELRVGSTLYSLKGSKKNGQIVLDSMSDVIFTVARVNDTEAGDAGIDGPEGEDIDEYVPPTDIGDDGVDYEDADQENRDSRPEDDDFDVKGNGEDE